MLDYEYVTSADRLPAIAEEISQAGVLALDTETTGLSPFSAEIRLLSVNTGRGVYVIDAFKARTLQPVVQSLADSKGVKILQNAKFDARFLLHKYNIELWPIFDTYRASALIYNGKFKGRGSHDLYALYARELETAPEAPDMGGSDWSLPELSKEQLDYAAEDVIYLPRLRDRLKPKLAALGLNRIALIEFQAIVPEAAIELAGIGFDKNAWLKLAEENAKKAEGLRRQLMHELPHPKSQMALPGFDPDFNLDSSAQLLVSLRKLGLQTSEGPIEDTNELNIAQFTKDYPVVGKLLDYRGYAQAVKTFGPEFVNHISKYTGRIHTDFFPFTGAGRYSSTKPNIQNIPRTADFRSCFCAAPGKKFILCDQSQVELRIVGEIANDPVLISAYVNDEDVHAKTASLVVGADINNISKEQRRQAKAIGFGFCFGMYEKKFVLYAQATYKVTLTLSEAKRFRAKYFDTYRGVRAWHDRIFSDDYKKRGHVRTLGGRIRYLSPEDHNEWANTPVQGTNADGLKASLHLVYERLRKYNGCARMVHMCHDEIIVEAEDEPELLKAVEQDLHDGMVEGVQPFLKKVPAAAETAIGDSWAAKS